MGSLTSRQEGTAEELDPEHVHSYKYPPKSGGSTMAAWLGHGSWLVLFSKFVTETNMSAS